MTQVSFDKVCRFCLTSNGTRAIYMVNGNAERLKSFTEFEFAQQLEKWMNDDKKKCEFCGAPYVEGQRIEIGSYKLYDYNRLVDACKESGGELFIWSASKKNRTVKLDVAGKQPCDPLFIEECFKKLLNTFNEYPEDKMIHNPEIGDIYVCFTGNYDFYSKSYHPVIQRLWCTGLAQHEALQFINAQLQNFGMKALA